MQIIVSPSKILGSALFSIKMTEIRERIFTVEKGLTGLNSFQTTLLMSPLNTTVQLLDLKRTEANSVMMVLFYEREKYCPLKDCS